MLELIFSRDSVVVGRRTASGFKYYEMKCKVGKPWIMDLDI